MRQRLDALFHLVVDVGEGELGALAMHRLRDAPGDRAISGDAYDEGALAGEKSHVVGLRAADYAAKARPRAELQVGRGISRGGWPSGSRSFCPA